MSRRVQRIFAYTILILVSFLCLFWFYALFINHFDLELFELIIMVILFSF